MKSSLRTIIFCGVFTALLAASAFIRSPMPLVPITLQAEMAILAGLLLGPTRGFCCALLYLGLGLAGLPIFSGGGGLSYVFRPGFGYLVGFCAAAFAAGWLARRSTNLGRLILAALTGLFLIYLFGFSYYYILGKYVLNQSLALGPLLVSSVLIFLPTDIPLCVLCAVLARRLRPHIKL